ncbi:MAG: ABC transporter substrate-binding protein [Gemmatimonadetes bacterium]|nr:ABC transporter substrate-binding protein [Gemmatimonadota bacterium]
MRRVIRFALGTVLVACAVGCRAGDTSTGDQADTTHRATIDLTRDDYGVAVVPGAAQRIVSLNPTTTEILFALGVGDRIVGRSRWDQWPEAARRVPALGDAIRPSVEQVLAARPDLVLLYASGDNRAAAAALGGAGITVVALRVDRIADFERCVRVLGRSPGATRRRAPPSTACVVRSPACAWPCKARHVRRSSCTSGTTRSWPSAVGASCPNSSTSPGGETCMPTVRNRRRRCRSRTWCGATRMRSLRGRSRSRDSPPMHGGRRCARAAGTRAGVRHRPRGATVDASR